MKILNEVVQIPITDVKGIGEETSELLHEMGIYTVSHLLEHFPYRYEDYAMKDLAEVKHEERVTVEGRYIVLLYYNTMERKNHVLLFVCLLDAI